MTLIPFQGGKPVMRDGKVGAGTECCCGGRCLLLESLAGCVTNPEFAPQSCQLIKANFEWFLAALQAAGWSASISTTGRPPDVPDNEYSYWGHIESCCYTSDLVCPPDGFGESDYENQPGWFNLSNYDGGIPYPYDSATNTELGVSFVLCGYDCFPPGPCTYTYSPTADAIFIPICPENPFP